MDERTSVGLLAGCVALGALFAPTASTSLAQALRSPYAGEPGGGAPVADVHVSRVEPAPRGPSARGPAPAAAKWPVSAAAEFPPADVLRGAPDTSAPAAALRP